MSKIVIAVLGFLGIAAVGQVAELTTLAKKASPSFTVADSNGKSESGGSGRG